MVSKKIENIFNYLAKNDKNLVPLLHTIKLPRERENGSGFATLAEIIISQQLSGKIVNTIISRFKEKHKLPERYDEKNLENAAIQSMRECGISKLKANYILGVRDLLLSNPNFFTELSCLLDKDLAKKLTKIKGVGSWTADVFMMTFYERLDIFPIKDASLQNAIRKIYKIEISNQSQMFHKIEENWKPYRTIVARLMWNAIDKKLI